MLFFEIILIAVGLSMDSLAVSVACGAAMKRCPVAGVLRIAVVLGLFQAGMASAGYIAGAGFYNYIRDYDHWIAFILLLFLGCKMIYEGTRPDKAGSESECKEIGNRMLFGLGIATSIDALAVGISLALLNTPLLTLALAIGIVTLLFSATGVYFGYHFRKKANIKFDLIGGLILIGIGIKILTEHLFFNG